jgi:polyhydroxybutyrate depolymerase
MARFKPPDGSAKVIHSEAMTVMPTDIEKPAEGIITRHLSANDKVRWYNLFLSPELDRSRSSPLILAFHGRGSRPNQFAYISQLSRRGGSAGYVIAYPAAEGGVWDASSKDSPDVAFVRAVLEDIPTVVPIDPLRIFATGMSNGGQMVYRLACELSDRLAAIAVCACGMSPGPTPTRNDISVLHFHGTEDKLAPYVWGESAVHRWIEFDQCDMPPTETYKNGAASCLTHSNLSTGASITFCKIDGMGHQWPGLAVRYSENETRLLGLPSILAHLGPGTDDLDATGVLLSFFASHTRKAAEQDASIG